MSRPDLEARIAERCGRRHCVMVRSGTVGLVLALEAMLGRRSGARVILPAITCQAVLSAIQLGERTPLLSDVSRSTYAPALADLARASRDGVDAVLAVHSFGIPCDVEGISTWADSRGAVVVEDACPGWGVPTARGVTGSFGPVSVVSFGYDKVIDASGGGAVLTDDLGIRDEVRGLVRSNPFFDVTEACRLEALDRELGTFDLMLERRAENAGLYHELLDDDAVEKPDISTGLPVWRYPCLVRGERAAVLDAARSAGLFISSHFHSLHYFRTGADFPVADEVSRAVINLPVRPDTSREFIKKAVALVNGFGMP